MLELRGFRMRLRIRGLRVGLVGLEIGAVAVQKIRRSLDDEQVFRVLVLSLLGEIKASGN